MKKKYFIIFILASVFINNSNAQSLKYGHPVSIVDSLDNSFLNWYNLDPIIDGIQGASVEKSYNILLVNKTPKKKIIVAVLDLGIDIYHEDLKSKIWINKNEIPNNGKDDDQNGYVDDINGWNFLGNENGENIEDEVLE